MRKLHFINKTVFFLNILFAVILLISLAAPNVSVSFFPFLSVLALSLPVLILINVSFLIYWILCKKKRVFLSFVPLIIWFIGYDSFYQFSFSKNNPTQEDLVVLSYNVRTFNKYKQLNISDSYEQFKELIDELKPDILCIQEIDHLKGLELKKEYPYQQMKYIYNNDKVLLGILSKYPIIESNTLDFPGTPNDGAYADILYGKDTIRVYNLHLQSLSIVPDTHTIVKESSTGLYKRAIKAFRKQKEQANIFREHCESTNHPTIVCGDFNNTQYSNVYNTIRGNMQDTFIEKGSGFGRTLNFFSFPLRIDFILADKSFMVKSHQNFDVELSDHFPVMSSFELID